MSLELPESQNPGNFTLPPSPPQSATRKELKLKLVATYLGAMRRRDVLLCLPRRVRDRIFSYLLDTDAVEFRYIEVPNIKDLRYPYHVEYSDLWYTETCELMIKQATFSISSDQAIFNFMIFLNEFEKHESYENVARLEFTDLRMFEKGEFSSNATKILRLCANIKHISLNINLNDLVWTYERGGGELSMDAMTAKYDFMTIVNLELLETVTLNLQPFMALEKRLAAMEQERQIVLLTGCILPGLDSFWGFKDWMELQALDQMKLIDVKCPSLVKASGY